LTHKKTVTSGLDSCDDGGGGDDDDDDDDDELTE